LFTSVHKSKRVSAKERQAYYKWAYDMFMKEYWDFKKRHKEVEISVSSQRKTIAGKNNRALLKVAIENMDKLDEQTAKELASQAKAISFRSVYNSVLAQLQTKVSMYDGEREGRVGRGQDTPYKPKMMKTVVHVDQDQANILANDTSTAKYVDYNDTETYETEIIEEIYT
jgi:hypothetical protein